jgi:hypothetical protein
MSLVKRGQKVFSIESGLAPKWAATRIIKDLMALKLAIRKFIHGRNSSQLKTTMVGATKSCQ